MHAARLLLMANSLVFGVFGLLCLVWPAGVADSLGITALPAGLIDFRATYGGLELGVGVFLAFCAKSDGGTPVGLLAASCAFGGFAGGRLVGILANGGADPMTYGFLLVETLALVLNAGMLRALHRQNQG